MVDKKLILDMLDKLPYAMQVSLLAGLTTGLTVADTKGVPHNDTSSPLPPPRRTQRGAALRDPRL